MTSKKGQVARGVIFVFVFVLLAVSFVAYRHSLPTGLAKYITYDHEVRRLLSRAERDNFRSALMVAQGRLMPDPPQEIGEIIPSMEFIATDYEIASIQHSPLRSKSLILDLSPVLNR